MVEQKTFEVTNRIFTDRGSEQMEEDMQQQQQQQQQ